MRKPQEPTTDDMRGKTGFGARPPATRGGEPREAPQEEPVGEKPAEEDAK